MIKHTPFSRFSRNLLVAAAVGCSCNTLAQQAAAGASVKEACASDLKTYVPDVQPGGGRIVACLRQNADKLSPGCKSALTAAKAARQAGR